ncbi:SDR family NAD(P)-dependent oxidoreductase [Serratia marcescens]
MKKCLNSVQQAIEKVVAKAGRIDVLVNSAGVSLTGAIEESSVEEAYHSALLL